MSKSISLLFILTLFTLFGCAGTLPPQKLKDSHRGAIGIIVRSASPIGGLFGSTANDRVYFIRLENDEDLYSAGYYIQSNHLDGDQIYLINVKPGRYSAVACYYKQSGTVYTSAFEYTTIFSKELIELTQIFVPEDKMTFMGEYIIDQSIDIDETDEAQVHYVQLIASGQATDWLGGAFARHGIYEGSLSQERRDKEAEYVFLTQALEDFKGTEWINHIQASLDDLKSTEQ